MADTIGRFEELTGSTPEVACVAENRLSITTPSGVLRG
jgi:hypothetical protein